MTRRANSAGFYAGLAVLPEFERFGEPGLYRELPDDWSVIVCDVAGSTEAVARGAYKTVNMIGAASIMAVLNVSGGVDIPYEFGGDGATLLVPPEIIDDAATALCALKNTARDVFGLELRVGAVPLAAIRRQGEPVSVARYRLGPANTQALFAGGVGLADRLVKSGPDFDLCTAALPAEPDLTGLSCRWEPLKASRGQIISLIVIGAATGHEERVRQAAKALSAVRQVTGPLSACAPANTASLSFRWPPRGAVLEARTLDAGRLRPRRLLRILFESLLQAIGHKFGLTFGDYNAPVYQQELMRQTDYRRYGDAIRLVLDCPDGADKGLRAALDPLEQAGEIIYGLHVSDHALMTCLVLNLKAGAHVHFIDGGDGGLTLAAKEFKTKLKS